VGVHLKYILQVSFFIPLLKTHEILHFDLTDKENRNHPLFVSRTLKYHIPVQTLEF